MGRFEPPERNSPYPMPANEPYWITSNEPCRIPAIKPHRMLLPGIFTWFPCKTGDFQGLPDFKTWGLFIIDFTILHRSARLHFACGPGTLRGIIDRNRLLM